MKTMSYLCCFVILLNISGCKKKPEESYHYTPYTPYTAYDNSYEKERSEKDRLKTKYPKTYNYCNSNKYTHYLLNNNNWLGALSLSLGLTNRYFVDCDDLLKNLDKKKTLDLSNRNLNDQQIDLLGEFTNVTEINLSGNQITKMKPIKVPGKHKLQIMDLSNNPITDLAGLEEFPDLKIIRVQKNTILNWREGILNLRRNPYSIVNHSIDTVFSANFYTTYSRYIKFAPNQLLDQAGFATTAPYHHYLTKTPYNQNHRDRNGRTLQENIQLNNQQQMNQALEQRRAQERVAAQELERQQRVLRERELQQQQQEQTRLIQRAQRRAQEDQLNDYQQIIRDFVNQGKFQHIIWLALAKLDEPNLTNRQRQEYQQNINNARLHLNRVFLETPMKDLVIEDFPHGTHQKYEVTFAHNIKAIFKVHGPFQDRPIVGNKPSSNALAEFISYKMDEVLDLRLVPFTVMRELTIENVNVLGSLQLKMEGQHVDVTQLANENPDLQIVQAIDYIVGNADRFNNGNLMTIDLNGQQKMVAIDFSEAFSIGHGGRLSNGKILNGRNIHPWNILFNGLVDGELHEPMIGQEIFPNLMPNRVKNKMNSINYEIDLLEWISQATFVNVNPNYVYAPHTKDLLLSNIKERFERIKRRIN